MDRNHFAWTDLARQCYSVSCILDNLKNFTVGKFERNIVDDGARTTRVSNFNTE